MVIGYILRSFGVFRASYEVCCVYLAGLPGISMELQGISEVYSCMNWVNKLIACSSHHHI